MSLDIANQAGIVREQFVPYCNRCVHVQVESAPSWLASMSVVQEHVRTQPPRGPWQRSGRPNHWSQSREP